MWRYGMRIGMLGRSPSLGLLVVLVVCGPATATGFFVNQQSVRGLGRVDAGNTAAADEPATIFFNPAGLTQLWKTQPGDDVQPDVQSSFAVHAIYPRWEIRNTGSTGATPGSGNNSVAYGGGENSSNPTPVLNLYAAKKLNDGRAAIGAGINMPFGLKTASNGDWFGRYDATKAWLITLNFSVVGAYDVNSWLTLGGGVDVQYAKTKLVNAIPNPIALGGPSAATDGRAETIGSAWTPGFNAGVLITPYPNTRIGLHYRSGMEHRIEGSQTISGLAGSIPGVVDLAAFNGSVGAHADLDLPAIATLGIRQEVGPLVLLGELEWFGWSSFNEIRIERDDGIFVAPREAAYRDAYALAIGAEYWLPGYPLRDSVIVRGGIHYDTTPTVDGFRDTTVPDSERLWLGLGASLRLAEGWYCDFAVNHVFFNNTSIALTRTFFDGTPLASAVRINGDVSTVVNTVSLGFRFAF